jgi:hypothetical protein
MLGKKVKCPQCATTFLASGDSEPGPLPEEERQPAPRSSSVRERPSPAGRQREEEPEGEERPRRRRPRDEEGEEEDYTRPVRRSGRRRADQDPHRGVLILVFGIISIACCVLGLIASLFVGPFALILFLPGLGLGIPAWAMGGRDLRRIDAGRMDPDGRGSTMGGYVMGIIGTILNGLLTFCCALGIVLAIAGFAALAGLSSDLQKKQNQPPPGKFQHRGSPLRLQGHLPGAIW